MTEAEVQELARDRHQRTPELHPGNDYYGHAATLKRYAGLPPDRPLHAIVEHGPAPAPRIWELDLRAPFTTFLCCGPMRAEVYERERPGARGIPIGPMIRYVTEGPPPPRPRGRLLVFPAHSTHHVRSVYDAPAFARRLAGYRDRFSEITVCLYWKDVLDGAQAPYRAEGFECVTAGHMYDLDFLTRLRRYLDEADVVVTNQFGSHIPYAVALGRPVWLIEQEVKVVGSRRALESDTVEREVLDELTREIRRLFSEETDEVTPEQRASLDAFTGFDCIRTPQEIRDLLAEASERYLRSTTAPQRAWHRFMGRVVRPLAARVR